ncbi:protein LNK2 isoform X6 [Abrus precatorius]|uniref:Protein LNK2 isoform X6 n=1 Tax=Abrus precatorius TaxID=3816 RepID=A0A8B8KJ61_ABRPR|nr:protein LNK2 isoform X6 [Abrus precatorius]
MFDWNDEELANIIWGEGVESDDHIVPYPEVNEDLSDKKEWNQEVAATKLKRPEAKSDFHERKLGSSSNLDNSGELPASGYGTNSWPDLSLSSAAKIDKGFLGTEVSKNLSEHSKFSSSREETIQHEKDAEIFQNAHEGKEQGDFVDYGWANIGSFDDLDRIFSNDDPIFGHASLNNYDELWSSKDESSNAAPLPLNTSSSGALRNRTEPLEIKEEYVQCNDESLDLSFEKIGGPASQVIQNSHKIPADMGSAGVRSKPTGKAQQVFRQKNILKTRKKLQVKQEGNALQGFYGNWSPSAAPEKQFENQLAPSVIQSSPSSILGQQKQIQGPETLYQNIINPYMASSVYGNLTNTYPAVPMLSQTQSRDLRHQPALSGYEVSPGIVNPVMNSVDSLRPQTMTPQEKIEKLRRRQQMQAMLAIQKQQQQLGHQVCSTVDNDFVEDAILYRLQDIISKLDIKIRLCIRDSLFRLAQSAMQRHYASDTSSTNKSSREELEVAAREESNVQNRYARIPDVETETNPIDRTVARLLFHRPMESTQNYSDKLESPISTKVQRESKTANLVNFPVSCLPNEDLKSNQQLSRLGFKNSWFEAQSMDQIKNSPCIDTSENASNTQELEASQ